jgi:hypothetical protein
MDEPYTGVEITKNLCSKVIFNLVSPRNSLFPPEKQATEAKYAHSNETLMFSQYRLSQRRGNYEQTALNIHGPLPLL